MQWSEVSIRTIPIRAERLSPPRGRFAELVYYQDTEREFFGDGEYARLYTEAVSRAAGLGWSVSEFDYRPFRETANLLYSGPWVAERFSATKSIVETNPNAVHPAVRAVILSARKFSAVDAFESQYRLAALARETERTWESFDALLAAFSRDDLHG